MYKLKKSLQCETCIGALFGSDNSTLHSLIRLKSKGYLVHPSDDVIDICQCCEKLFQKSVAGCSYKDISLGRKDFLKIVVSVLECYAFKKIFSDLSEHMYETDSIQNHMILFIKAIAEKYLQVRYSYAAKQFTSRLLEKKKKMKSRQTYTKWIHFSSQ